MFDHWVTDSSTVFLSANRFVQPYEHLSQVVNKRMVQSYVAYLKDDTRLISNPGLKVILLNKISNFHDIQLCINGLLP